MGNFAALYCYECKKLVKKKILWITFLLVAAAILCSSCIDVVGEYYVDGVLVDTNYNLYVADRAYAQALSGRPIDQTLLEETIAAYRKIPEEPENHYTLTREYQTYARPYSAIFNFIHETTHMQSSQIRLTWQPSEGDLYAKRLEFLEDLRKEYRLSQGEMAFWQNREAQIPKPIVYEDQGSWDKLLSAFQTVGLLELLLVSISLSGIFYDEHTRKTDQILLACPLGKEKLYWAKLGAGISFSAVSAFLLTVTAFGAAFVLYGTEGFEAAFQLMYPRSSDPITCGQAMLLAYGCMGMAAVAVGIFVMVLSELLHGNLAALSVSVGLMLLAMIVSIPAQYRVSAQIWDWLPWCFLTPWNVFGCYTLPLFGQYLSPWQAVPGIYLAASIALALLGKPLYKHYQVSGR